MLSDTSSFQQLKKEDMTGQGESRKSAIHIQSNKRIEGGSDVGFSQELKLLKAATGN